MVVPSQQATTSQGWNLLKCHSAAIHIRDNITPGMWVIFQMSTTQEPNIYIYVFIFGITNYHLSSYGLFIGHIVSHCVKQQDWVLSSNSWLFGETTTCWNQAKYVVTSCISRLQTSHTPEGPSRSCSRSGLQTSDQHFSNLSLIKTAKSEQTNYHYYN